MSIKMRTTLNFPPGDNPRGPPVLCRGGQWWIFNRQWVEEATLVNELRRFAPGHTIVEMAYHVGLWNIDRAKLLNLLKKYEISTEMFQPVRYVKGRNLASTWVEDVPRWIPAPTSSDTMGHTKAVTPPRQREVVLSPE